MVDTERFQLGPELIELVTVVAANLARRNAERKINALQVATYVPLDVDSVGRILESLEKDYDVERIDEGGICYFQFAASTADDGDDGGADEAERLARPELDIEGGEHLGDLEHLEDNLSALDSDEGWSRKVREQHELLRIAAESDERTVELSYFLSRTEIPSARAQSILNDFGAESFVQHSFDEDEDLLEYTFPELEYPEERIERHYEILDRLEDSDETNPIWILLGAFAFLLLITIIVIRVAA